MRLPATEQGTVTSPTTQSGKHNTKMREIEWKASDLSNAEFLGTMEIEDKHGEFHPFEIMLVKGDRYVFGGTCNAGFLESGFMLLENDSGELEELKSELQTFYDDGPGYTTRIQFNERM